MRMVDLIEKKKTGGKLTAEEIAFAVREYVSGEIPDYQMSAMLMAIWYKGMDAEETAELTLSMEHSGDVVDLSPIPGVKVDKHSTGGVGDKTTLIVGPIVAACGVKIAKMSGRGLGHTGGTLDKLESIPGFRIGLSRNEFFDTVRRTGIAVIGQTGNVVPADKKIYALRDVTATVDSIPLIASSIMSKKLAAGSDAIVLDVKTGSGAFMKTMDDAIQLAQTMVDIGRHAGKRVTALITEMDIPLGECIGNANEVEEAVKVLQGGGPEDLREVALSLASEMIALADMQPEVSTDGDGSKPVSKDYLADPDSDWLSSEKKSGIGGNDATKAVMGKHMRLARKKAEEALFSGKAFRKFCDLVKAQGGDVEVILHPEKLPKAAFAHEVKASSEGYISHMDTEGIGTAAMLLGAGRETKDQEVDHAAGIRLMKKTGDLVRPGEILAVLYTNKEASLSEAESRFLAAVSFDENPQKLRPLILARVNDKGVEIF